MIEKLIWRKYISLIFVLMLLIVSVLPLVSGLIIINPPRIEQLDSPRGNDWWSMFRHDSTRTGFSTSNAPDTKEVLWSYQTDYFISSSPVVAHGRVYIGSWDRKIYCFDMDNGDLLWDYSTNGQITSSPAVANGKVYIGSQDSEFYCLDAINGDYIWKYDTNFMIESSPTVKDDKVFFGSSDGSLYCLNANDGSLIWNYPTGNVIWSSPAVTDDKVYFGSLTGDFLCLDIIDGDLIWDYPTTSGIWSSPAVTDDKVYFGSNDYYVYCLDADDGSYVWSYNTLSEVHSSPAIACDYVYIGSMDGRLLCLNKETGALVWSYPIDGSVWSQPSLADGMVYFGTYPCCSDNSYLLCLDAYTGTKIWDYNLGTPVGMKSSPAIAASKVFVASGEGEVITFGEIEYMADANGPYYSYVNISVNFTGSVYGGEPDYSWYWDFGDGNTSIEQNPTHTYTAVGKYDVTLTVTDAEDKDVTDETYALIKMLPSNNPPDKPIIDGPTKGNPGVEYEFTFFTTDPDGDKVYYLIDWGDGTYEEWIGPYKSGADVVASHAWHLGTYRITVKAKDIFDAESDLSIPFYITITKNRIATNSLLLRLFQIMRYLFVM